MFDVPVQRAIEKSDGRLSPRPPLKNRDMIRARPPSPLGGYGIDRVKGAEIFLMDKKAIGVTRFYYTIYYTINRKGA